MDFPQIISFTVTNACNLRCKMCGQWSENGYITKNVKDPAAKMELEDWKRLTDEIAVQDVQMILIRGGEPFLFPGISDLLDYINKKHIYMSIDTNGSLLHKFIRDLIKMENLHITVSIDGPEEIHDKVRGRKGSFRQIKKNIALLNEIEDETGRKISKSICFTISQFSYKGLGRMPSVARDLGIKSINIVPCYYFSYAIGKKYEKEIQHLSGSSAFSWKGFRQDDPGIDIELLTEQLKEYKENLGEIENFPYMAFSEQEYKIWFSDPFTPVGSPLCMNVERLIDIQPGGEANFCVDFPDYCIGNVKNSTIKELWNSAPAEKFREYRRIKPLSICFRCGAKYIAELH